MPKPAKGAATHRRVTSLFFIDGVPLKSRPDGRLSLVTRRRRPCHGFANGCTCGCKPKRPRPAKAAGGPRQPWQPKPRKAA